MFYRIIISAGLIMASVAGQISLLGGLPDGLSFFNLPLLFLLFLLLTSEKSYFLWLAWAAGFYLDIFSFLSFGLYSIAYLSSVLVGQVLLKHFFTNRSVYTFTVMGALTNLFFNLIFSLMLTFFSFSSADFNPWLEASFWARVGLSALVNGLAMMFIFYGFHFFRGRFRSANKKSVF